MNKTKEERLISFIKNNPRHSFARQFTLKRMKDIKEESELTCRLIARNKFVLKREGRERAILMINEKRGKEKERKNRKRIRRTANIVDWYLQGLTYEQVGKKFRVSRERIRQILNRAKEDGLDFEIRGMKRREGVYQTRTCLCGKEFEVYIPKGGASKKQVCSRICKQKYRIGYKYKSPEEAKIARRALNRERYHNDPEFRKRGDLARKNYYLKTRHNPGYIERQKIYSKRWMEKMRNDPALRVKYLEREEQIKKKNIEKYHGIKKNHPKKYRELRAADSERQKKYFRKLYADPIRYAVYLERTRVQAKKNYQRLKKDPKRYKKHLEKIKLNYRKRRLLLDKLGPKNKIEGSVIKNKNGKR